MPEQLPITAAYKVGGQSAVANKVVNTEADSFEEDAETKHVATGQFGAEITYSRRATKTLTMELAHGATVADYMEGGHVDATFAPGGTAAWEIRSVQQIKTRGPIQLTLELVSLTESIAAPS